MKVTSINQNMAKEGQRQGKSGAELLGQPDRSLKIRKQKLQQNSTKIKNKTCKKKDKREGGKSRAELLGEPGRTLKIRK